MSAPRRLREETLPRDLARMLAAAPRTRALPPDVAGRVKKRLAVVALPAVASIILSWKGFALASLAVAGAVGARAVVVHRAPPPSPVAHAPLGAFGARAGNGIPAPPVASTARVEEVPPPPDDLDAFRSTPHATPSRPAVSPPAAGFGPNSGAGPALSSAPTSGDSLGAELGLIGRARASLDAAPSTTLAILDEHARQFPAGKLAMERELLALDALERLGRRTEASARAAQLLPRAAGTIYEARVAAHLKGDR